MTFKKRYFVCEACAARVERFSWNTEPAPMCETHQQPMIETGSPLSAAPNRGVVDDTVIGGRWCETMGDKPFFYTSKSELRREAERRGLVNVVRHDDAYYATKRKRHDEELRDVGRNAEY